jgi:hypothetical protein
LIFSFCGIGYFCNWNNDWEPFVVLNKIEALKRIVNFANYQKSLLDLDANLIPSEKNYEDIKTAIQQMGLEYDENTYFKRIWNYFNKYFG